MKSLLYVLKNYAEEGHSEMEEFAIPSFDDVTNKWKFTWREEKNEYFSQDYFNRLMFSYACLHTMRNLEMDFLLYG